MRLTNYSKGGLRPAFGSGEDWNIFPLLVGRHYLELRPAFGSGEDWNSSGAG